MILTPKDWARNEALRAELQNLLTDGSVLDMALQTLSLCNMPCAEIPHPPGWTAEMSVLAEHMRQAGVQQAIQAIRDLPSRVLEANLKEKFVLPPPYTYITDPRPAGPIPKPKPTRKHA